MKIVASLHGANGVVIQMLEQPLLDDEPEASFETLHALAWVNWRESILRGCRVVVGIPDDNTV